MPRTMQINWLVVCGVLFLLYALLGNYVALPGYLRFLARGEVSAAGNAFDLDVLIGAAKTIAWMFSFQLGVLCLAIAYARANKLAARYVAIGGLVWLTCWVWPSLPLPPAMFYATFGIILLITIAIVLQKPDQAQPSDTARTLQLGAIVFFAFATWEICGLGTTGRMLHPAEASAAMPHNILVTQSTKLMLELVFAWSLLAASRLCAHQPAASGPA